MNYKRRILLPEKPEKSFFLWGPRQTGKTTLLRNTYPDAFRVDLLKTDELIRYASRPSLFREEVLALPKNQFIVVDEIQKVPALLDEIHYLIEEDGRVFGLCGSSARKVKRGHANLLGGRAIRYELFGFCAIELGKDFQLEQFVNTGPIPNHYLTEEPALAIRSYVEDYLHEEVFAEGLTRNLALFSDFLRVAAIGDTEILSYSNIARESGVKLSTVRDHYEILVDTLLGAYLPAFVRRQKRRVVHSPKFYFRDVGVVNHLARRGLVKIGSELFGKAFENWLFHELSVHAKYSNLHYDLSYWRLASGIEVDFVLGDGAVAIEAKGKSQINSVDLKGLYHFKQEHPNVKHLLLVCLESKTRKTEDGIWIFPYNEFIHRLWEGAWTQDL